VCAIADVAKEHTAGHIAHTPADASDAIAAMHRKNLAHIDVRIAGLSTKI